MAELVVVVAIVGVFAALAVPASDQWFDDRRLNTSARSFSSAFTYARGEAIRTGNIHVVFVYRDALGNTLSSEGTTVPILVLDDGRPGATGQNCKIDSGETTRGYTMEDGVTFGVTHANVVVPSDAGNGAQSSGSTFTDAGGSAATWALFRPEGTPLAFSSNCTTGDVGSGGGGVYITNGERDLAIVLTPLGATRVHFWNIESGVWSN